MLKLNVCREILIILFIYLIITYQLTFAQISLPNTIEANKTYEPIVLDGKFDELSWKEAKKIRNFTQRELMEGVAASELTETAALYSEESLFIGVWCYESEPNKIVAKQMKRDFNPELDDNIKIMIDTYHDRRNGYLFIINPNGARNDAVLVDDGRSANEDWNGVWDCEVNVNNEGWFVEIELPFSTLKFSDNQTQIWGFNIERNIRSKNEQVLWQGWSRDYSFNQISNAGTLIGLENIKSTHQIEIKPFVNSGFEKNTNSSMKKVAKLGGDINYLITPTLRLNFTVNTDFAQVEADKAEVNLTRFSISYPEKREFFLEEKDFFDFNMGDNYKIFYSRKIGIDGNEEIPIIAGGKISGKIGRSDIGFLSIQSASKGFIPSTNHTVLRFKQDVLEQSNVGLILTAQNSSDHYNYVYGINGNFATSNLFGDKNFSIGGSFSQSQTENASRKRNLSYQFYLSYPNDLIEYDLQFTTIQKNFNPELGFLDRSNFKFIYMELQFNPRPEFIPWIKKGEIKPIDMDLFFTDETNELESAEFEWRPIGFSTKSGEAFEFNIKRTFDRLNEDFEIHENAFIPKGKYWFTHYEVQLETYESRNISITNKIKFGNFYNGHRTEIQCELKWNLSNHFNLFVDYQKNIISLPTINFGTNEVGARIDYAITTKMYTSIFGQWNNDDDELILNFRFNWIPQIGSDFYFVVNQKLSGNHFNFYTKNLTVLAKLIWRFTI